jgi:hypothetical protein
MIIPNIWKNKKWSKPPTRKEKANQPSKFSGSLFLDQHWHPNATTLNVKLKTLKNAISHLRMDY